MIKKQELLRRLENVEKEIDELRYVRNSDTDIIDINTKRVDYVLRFLADKLGYEIKLKDVVKVNYKGEKSIATEVKMVEKKLTVPSSPKISSLYDFMTASSGCGDCCEPKPKHIKKINKKETAKKKQVKKQ